MNTKELIKAVKNERGSAFQNCNDCEYGTHNGEVIEKLNRLAELEDKIEQGTLKEIPEHAVVFIPTEEKYAILSQKEYQRYERIEKIIKLAKMEKANGYEVKNGKLYYFSNMLGGCEIEFKDLQEICDMANHYNEEFYGLDQRLTFWKSKAEDTRKETAENFAERLKERLNEWLEDNEDLYGKINFGIAEIELIGVKSLEGEIISESLIDEICKEITENGETVTGRIPHWATCPQFKNFKKEGSK